jgi:hypothetical protein
MIEMRGQESFPDRVFVCALCLDKSREIVMLDDEQHYKEGNAKRFAKTSGPTRDYDELRYFSSIVL